MTYVTYSNKPKSDTAAELKRFLLQPLQETISFLKVINPDSSDEDAMDQEEDLKYVTRQQCYGGKKTITKEMINFLTELEEIYDVLGIKLFSDIFSCCV